MFTVISPEGISTHSNSVNAIEALRAVIYLYRSDADSISAMTVSSANDNPGTLILVTGTHNGVAIIRHSS